MLTRAEFPVEYLQASKLQRYPVMTVMTTLEGTFSIETTSLNIGTNHCTLRTLHLWKFFTGNAAGIVLFCLLLSQYINAHSSENSQLTVYSWFYDWLYCMCFMSEVQFPVPVTMRGLGVFLKAV